MIGFRVEATDPGSRARAGVLRTGRCDVLTPVFMPVGTYGAVKALAPAELRAAGAGILLGNTYHLALRPGHDLIGRLGGLHRFMSWDGAILTDSGGFQVFSLASLRRVAEEGVEFRSHVDGAAHLLSPETSVKIQQTLGSDIMMALDICPPGSASRAEVASAMERTFRWARRSLDARLVGRALFGIVQGGVHEDLRARSAAATAELPFDGFAIGGVSVGEPREEIDRIVRFTAPLLPPERPRYLMGVGTPRDLLEGVASGVDMFDCVLPTRNARNGTLFTWRGLVRIKRATYQEDPSPLDAGCPCDACRFHSKAYLRHLFMTREILSMRLNTLHNIFFYQQLMRRARRAIVERRFAAWMREVLPGLTGGDGEEP